MWAPKSLVYLHGYSRDQFRSDLGAGVVVGLVALPLAMAFAIASGLPPERGLYTAIIAGFLVSALGGSRVQIGGPTGAFVVIVSGIVAQYGYDGLALATLMAGGILILMGLARFGDLIKFIPYPVTTGFTSGIAVIILSTQVKDFLGLHLDRVPSEFIEKWDAYLHVLSTTNLWAAGLALFTTLCIALWPKAWNRVPGSLIALILCSIAAAAWSLPVETIQSRFGGVPHSLPSPAFPAWSFAQAKALIPAATTVAILAAIESLLSAVVADGMIGGRHKSNVELIAQGIANLCSPLFGGIPATGAIARTATNVKNGGRTPMAGMIHALVLLLILMMAGSLAAKIPLACLAGVLVVVSYHMSEWRSFKTIFSGPRSDIMVLLTTFSLTVLVDLTVAVEVGMILAAFLFMKQMADTTQIKTLAREKPATHGAEHLHPSAIPAGVEVFTIQGSLFFGAANKLVEVIRIMSSPPRALILEMSGLLHMDATGLHVLGQIHQDCLHRKIRLMIAGVHTQPFLVLQQAGKFDAFGKENFHENLERCFLALEDPPRTHFPD